MSELCALRWNQVDFEAGLLHVRRLKHGIPSVHPLHGPELRALRKLQRESDPSPYLFVTERGSPMTATGFRKLLSRIGSNSSLTFSVHPHMLRHGCGYKLVNDGHDTRSIQHYLGHKNIQHTVRYTDLSPDCFNDFWQEDETVPGHCFYQQDGVYRHERLNSSFHRCRARCVRHPLEN